MQAFEEVTTEEIFNKYTSLIKQGSDINEEMLHHFSADEMIALLDVILYFLVTFEDKENEDFLVYLGQKIYSILELTESEGESLH